MHSDDGGSVRRILVTGGSRGLGLAFCRHYLDSGHAVFTCGRSQTDEVALLERDHADRFFFRAIDLAAPGAPGELVRLAEERLGAIDVLVNNAAVGQDALLAHISDDEIAAIVHLNLTVVLQLTRQVIRRMMIGGGGVVLNVSSISATRGYPGLTVYSATKSALEALTRSLARELGAARITVNALAPGFFASEMSRVLAPGEIETIRNRTPTRALTTPEQVARASDILIAPGTNITGQVIAVDGGASAC